MTTLHESSGHVVAAKLQDGRVLAISGWGGGSLTHVTELYDPATGQWTQTGPINDARYAFHSAAVLNNGKVLVAGGHDELVNDYASAELYDPATGQWSYTGRLHTSRRYAVTTKLLDGRVLVATGAHGVPDCNRFLSSAELYDPATGQWSYTSPAPTSRESATGIRLNDGRVMIVGGYSCTGTPEAANFHPETDLYNPATGTWSRGGNFPRPRAGESMGLVVLQDGRALAVGGHVSDGGATAEAHIFNPVTNQWSSTTPMHFTRDAVDAVPLPDGKVLVAGGRDSSLQSEIYDPATGVWTLDAPLSSPHVGGKMIALNTGCVLIVGGGNTVAELYGEPQPPTDTTPPTVKITSPSSGASYTTGQAVTAGYTCADEAGGSGLASCTGQVNGITVANGGSLPTQTGGAQTLVVTARDNAGNPTTATAPYVVFASFGDASGRVEAPPAVNAAIKAGATVPIKFSLSGDHGLGIFAAGSPSWQQVSCTTWAGDPTEPGTPTEVSAATGLSYDATTDQYNYRWKTDKAWAGQCWQLTMQFGPNVGAYTGGTIMFNFRFDK